MEETLRLIDLVAPTPISVLLLGETGVGKGYLARRIVQRSPRASGPWLHLNCAALPEHLLESELFGYERGAFTGATQTKPGLLEAASGGTVFLDEVGDLPPSVQAKLLTALERGEVIRIGGLKPVRFDVRFISATNRLLSATSRSSFRPDLYYRLAGMPIIVPPLRDRRDELPGLLGTLVKDSSARLGRLPPHVDASVLTALAGYDWAGQHQRARERPSSGPSCWPARRCSRTTSACRGRAVASSPPPSSRPAPRLDDAPTANTGLRLADEVNEIERRRVLEALERSAGNQVRAAEALGISRRTLNQPDGGLWDPPAAEGLSLTVPLLPVRATVGFVSLAGASGSSTGFVSCAQAKSSASCSLPAALGPVSSSSAAAISSADAKRPALGARRGRARRRCPTRARAPRAASPRAARHGA
jgi:two-component system response regulator AtoC